MESMTSPTEQQPTPINRFTDPFFWITIALLGFMALLVWSVARDRIVEPFDRFVTEQHCLDTGNELEREALGFERSNRFGLRNRSEGLCQFGEGPNGEAPMTMTLEQTAPGPLFRAFKGFGIVIQLGIVSIFLRLIVDPTLELFRAVRARV